jgi:hypothetical protein
MLERSAIARHRQRPRQSTGPSSHARAVVLRSQTRSMSVFHVMAMPVFSLMAPSVIRHYRRWPREQWLTWRARCPYPHTTAGANL